MNKEIAEKWVKALRSGEYKQGASYLNKANERFCCLGVLCEVMEVPKFETLGRTYAYGKAGHEASLPFEVLMSAGLSIVALGIEALGGFDYQFSKIRWPKDFPELAKEFRSLAEFNDNGVSFAQIADFIELNSEVL